MKLLPIIVLLFMVGTATAADVTILFKDSTNIEDADGYGAAGLSNDNYGRRTSGAAGRVILNLGNNYGSYYFIWMKIPTFKDSTDNHSGLIIDSAVLVMFVQTASYDANDQSYLAAIGIDTNMTWVEGNQNGGDALNCAMCFDSAQTVGSGGSCASKLAWNTAGARGANDTMGIYTGEPEDSTCNGGQQIFDWEAAGDSVYIYLDTAMMNFWKDYSYANEGFVIHNWDGPNDQYSTVFYGSETNGGALNDSIPYVKLYGHTTDEGGQTGRRRRLLTGQ